MARNIFELSVDTLFRASRNYDKLKQDPTKRKVSTKLGVNSILTSLVGCVGTVLMVYLVIICARCIGGFSSSTYNLVLAVFAIIGIIVFAVLTLGFLLNGVIGGLSNSIYQMKLNRRVIGIISLLVWFVLLVVAIVGVVLIATH